MKRMQSPVLNRKGEYEIHDVPDRKVEGLRAKGWREVLRENEESGVASGEFQLTNRVWFSVRSEIRELLGLETYPSTKAEARELLENAGYTVK